MNIQSILARKISTEKLRLATGEQLQDPYTLEEKWNKVFPEKRKNFHPDDFRKQEYFFFSGLILKSTGKVNKQWRNVTNRTKSGFG